MINKLPSGSHPAYFKGVRIKNNLPTRVKYHINHESDWYYNEDNLPMEHDILPEQELNFEPNNR